MNWVQEILGITTRPGKVFKYGPVSGEIKYYNPSIQTRHMFGKKVNWVREIESIAITIKSSRGIEVRCYSIMRKALYWEKSFNSQKRYDIMTALN